MALVVAAVEVLAVPAGGEEGLGSQASARQATEVRSITLVWAIEADMRDGALFRVRLIIGSTTMVMCKQGFFIQVVATE